MKATAFTSTYWDCPGCHERVFLRDVVLKFDEVTHVGPEEPLDCPACGYSLSDKEAQPTRCGGLLRCGWWTVCGSCFRDIYSAETVYSPGLFGETAESPPPVLKCPACGEEQEVSLPEA
jgi:rubrerythrin